MSLLGILSDTHNNLENARATADLLCTRGVSRVFHCGDITGPTIIQVLAGFEISYVFGNIDADYAALSAAAGQAIDTFYTTEIDGLRIAMTHGHLEKRLAEAIHSGAYDLVLHGHTHRRRHEQAGPTLVINPGALGGRKVEPRSVCLFETSTRTAEFIELA